MKNIGKWILGAAIVAGGLGLGATTAQAAQVRVYVGSAAYIPPSPGPGYIWVAGYYNGGYWVPGYWNYVGVGYRYYDRDDFRYYRHFDRDDWRHWDRDHDRRFYYRDRDDHHRDHDRDHDRWRR